MSGLKLLALDTEDLSVISTHMQDSVFKLKDVAFEAKQGQFTLSANRFVWESANKKNLPPERCRSVVFLKRVSAVRSHGINRSDKEQVLSGGGAIALDVECIEAQLTDVSGAWETAAKPHHPDSE